MTERRWVHLHKPPMPEPFIINDLCKLHLEVPALYREEALEYEATGIICIVPVTETFSVIPLHGGRMYGIVITEWMSETGPGPQDRLLEVIALHVFKVQKRGLKDPAAVDVARQRLDLYQRMRQP